MLPTTSARVHGHGVVRCVHVDGGSAVAANAVAEGRHGRGQEVLVLLLIEDLRSGIGSRGVPRRIRGRHVRLLSFLHLSRARGACPVLVWVVLGRGNVRSPLGGTHVLVLLPRGEEARGIKPFKMPGKLRTAFADQGNNNARFASQACLLCRGGSL